MHPRDSTPRSHRRGLHRVRSWLRGAAPVLALLLLAGCVKNFPNPFSGSSGGSSSQIQVFVDNQNFNDVRLYTDGPEGRNNVGVVTGRSTRTLEVPWRQTATLRFEVEPLAGRAYRTNGVTASPGDRLQLFIRENPNNTFLTRR